MTDFTSKNTVYYDVLQYNSQNTPIQANSDNKLIQEKLGWAPNYPLYNGLTETFKWINKQVNG